MSTGHPEFASPTKRGQEGNSQPIPKAHVGRTKVGGYKQDLSVRLDNFS